MDFYTINLCLSLAKKKDSRMLKEVQNIRGDEHTFLLGFYYRLSGRYQEALEKFNKIVEPIDTNIENLHTQNQRLKEARDILLPRLMTGVIKLSESGFAGLEDKKY